MAYTYNPDKHSKSHAQDMESSTRSHIPSQTKNKQAQGNASNVMACDAAYDQKKLIFLPLIPLQLVAGSLGLAAGGLGLGRGMVGLSQRLAEVRYERVEMVTAGGNGPREEKENKEKKRDESKKKKDDKLKKWNSKIKGCKPPRLPRKKDGSCSCSSSSSSDEEDNENSHSDGKTIRTAAPTKVLSLQDFDWNHESSITTWGLNA